MGRYDKEPRKKSSYIRTIIFATGVFFITFFILNTMSASEDKDLMCSEITTFMLDDPEHMRIHNDYPTIMNNLHLYLDANCETMDENNPLSVKP